MAVERPHESASRRLFAEYGFTKNQIRTGLIRDYFVHFSALPDPGSKPIPSWAVVQGDTQGPRSYCIYQSDGTTWAELVGAPGIRWAVVTPAGQNNLNANIAGTRINWASAANNGLTGFAVAGGNITIEAGTYLMTWSAGLTAANARTNLGWRFESGALALGLAHGSNYIRAATGHNEAGDTFTRIVTIPANTTTFGVDGFREAGAGVVTLVAARSQLTILRLA